jgi:hypothetical protein
MQVTLNIDDTLLNDIKREFHTENIEFVIKSILEQYKKDKNLADFNESKEGILNSIRDGFKDVKAFQNGEVNRTIPLKDFIRELKKDVNNV